MTSWRPSDSDRTDAAPIFFDSPYFRLYRDGRVDRLVGTDEVAAGVSTEGVISKDVVTADGVSARLYLPPNTDSKIPVLLFFHGGAFIVESSSSVTYHAYVNSLVSKARVLAVSVDYRRAPEHPLPAAYDDCWVALQWAVARNDEWIGEHGDISRVFLVGDSAGANIAVQLALRLGTGAERTVTVEGVVLLHPAFSGKDRLPEEPVEEHEFAAKVWDVALPSAVDGLDDPRTNPISPAAADLELLGCARLLVCAAARDGLRARARAFFEAVRSSRWRGEAEWFESEGRGHVFFLFKPSSREAAELMDHVVHFIAHRPSAARM